MILNNQIFRKCLGAGGSSSSQLQKIKDSIRLKQKRFFLVSNKSKIKGLNSDFDY